MGTHRTVWRRTATRVLAAATALAAQAAFAATVEDCAAAEDAAAESACMDGLASASATPEVVESSIALLDRLPGGKLVFQLANGQAWVQQSARFIVVEAGEQVIVAPARLTGGHILTTERSATTRVQRLEEPSAGEREGPAPRTKEPSAGEQASAPRSATEPPLAGAGPNADSTDVRAQ